MVSPADPPAPMVAEAPMGDAKLLPVAAEEPAKAEPAAEEAAGAVAVVSEEERGKILEENQGDPKADAEKGEDGGEGKEKEAVVQKSSSFKEESNFPSDLKEHERKALMELRAMVDEAVRANKLFPVEEAKGVEKESKEEAKSAENGNVETEKEKEVKDETEKKEESKDETEKKEEVKSEEHTEKETEEEEVKSEKHTEKEAEKEGEREEKVKPEEHTKEGADKKEGAKSEEHTKGVVVGDGGVPVGDGGVPVGDNGGVVEDDGGAVVVVEDDGGAVVVVGDDGKTKKHAKEVAEKGADKKEEAKSEEHTKGVVVGDGGVPVGDGGVPVGDDGGVVEDDGGAVVVVGDDGGAVVVVGDDGKTKKHAKEVAEKGADKKEEAKSEEHTKGVVVGDGGVPVGDDGGVVEDDGGAVVVVEDDGGAVVVVEDDGGAVVVVGDDGKTKKHAKEVAEKGADKKEAKSEEHTKEVVVEDDGKTKEHAKGVAEKETDISLWGVPLLGSKGSQGTDIILLKFLRARDFRAKEAFEMLRSTLLWRKDARIDSILEESLGEGLEAAAYMDGADREGHPVCYNTYGVFQDSALYEKAFGSEEKVERFLRWRFQLMEKGILKLDLRPGGVASILQITDLKDSPGISKREIRSAMKRAVGLLQDNYPEFVAKNIFINVPFWYYAFNSLLSPFLTQRTKSKFVFSRPAMVTETLLKYIPAEDIPVHYGGLKRENDTEFSVEDGGVSELTVKSGATENVEIPITEAGTTVVWDLTVVGWEVNYKEEFVPTDEASYTILLQKGKKMGSQEQAVRNSFRNNEPGKVVLIIENNTFWKKKALYRFKTKSSS